MDQEKLKKLVNDEILKAMEVMLNYADIIITDDHQYKKFRGKCLRAINDSMRAILKEIDEIE